MSTSTPFDPLRAAREELAGLSDVQRALTRRENACEEAMSLAEQELNAIRKITGYVRLSIDTLRQRITELERERELEHAK
jgi:phage shock protein A